MVGMRQLTSTATFPLLLPITKYSSHTSTIFLFGLFYLYSSIFLHSHYYRLYTAHTHTLTHTHNTNKHTYAYISMSSSPALDKRKGKGKAAPTITAANTREQRALRYQKQTAVLRRQQRHIGPLERKQGLAKTSSVLLVPPSRQLLQRKGLGQEGRVMVALSVEGEVWCCCRCWLFVG
ncbi:MAG: hypothetical protein J3R72DRAFT_240098 [Linnemannia gamsii]|nr:MAG: hypothetical protein J3R72DRAFT_240098 [Linnemannia gamsii]